MRQPNRSAALPGKSPKKRLLNVRTIGVSLVLSVLLVGAAQHILTLGPVASVMAQESVHPNHMSGEPFEPLVNGSVQPELIPDSAAVHALMQTLRIGADADEAALKRLNARARKIGLSETDFAILVRELGVLDTRARQQEARIDAARPAIREVGSEAVTRYVNEQGKLGALVEEHYEQLLDSVSPEGALKLQEYLGHIKSRIKIYPSPDMSPASN